MHEGRAGGAFAASTGNRRSVITRPCTFESVWLAGLRHFHWRGIDEGLQYWEHPPGAVEHPIRYGFGKPDKVLDEKLLPLFFGVMHGNDCVGSDNTAAR
jgi:hypothetical protein